MTGVRLPRWMAIRSTTLRRYESDLQVEGFEFTGGAFLEAVSVCFVEEDGAEYRRACLKEAEWVAEQQSSSSLDYVIAGTAPLEDPDVPDLLEKLSECRGYQRHSANPQFRAFMASQRATRRPAGPA